MNLAIGTILISLSSTVPAQSMYSYGPFEEGIRTCQDDVELKVRKHQSAKNKIVISWDDYTFTLHKVPTNTGVHRYEGAQSKIVYIQIPKTSYVLNHYTMKPLLVDCEK